MSAIAQKLCDEICEESQEKPSRQSIRESYKKLNRPSSSRYDGRPTRSIMVEKKKVINKVVPSDHTSKTKIINKFKSRETLLNKKFIDIGSNTIVSGPLRCDHDCVTMVRKRDPKSSCKSTFNGSKCKMSAKEIQTFELKSYSVLDKACAHCIETVNCGTQFFERLSSRSRTPNVKSKVRLCNGVTQTTGSTQDNENNKRDIDRSRMEMPANKSNIYNYMGAKRWALSHYPTRGPDF